MKRLNKLLAALLAALMIAAVLPAAAIAGSASEARMQRVLDKAFESILAVEKSAVELKASPAEVTLAAYKAALNEQLIDKGSIRIENEEVFGFTVEGMHCIYSYRLRNVKHVSAVGSGALEALAEKSDNLSSSKNVLLCGPYYGVDSSFTTQYKTEAQSIANKTGGTYTLLSDSSATGPAIASNFTNKAVILLDSHGVAYSTSTYMALTTDTGITNSDYNKGWALYSSDGTACIDGRYIQGHASGNLANCMVWMAFCEGMKKSGKGTTANALIAKGAACVYGYSQNVTFTGDYKYEAKFWSEMKKGSTVAEAIATMKATWGNWDPAYSSSSGAAWPIVVSPVDPFPSNPDSAQTVYCDWSLLGDAYVVTFVDWDGTVLKTETVAKGNAATPPSDPTRPGYNFIGWDTDFSNVQSDLTVTALYSAKQYLLTIYYQNEDGDDIAEPYQEYLANGAVYNVVSPTVPGYTPETEVVSGTMGAYDYTVTVYYIADETPVEPTVYGDVDLNGIVDMSDVSMLFSYLGGGASLTAVGAANADVNGDGVISVMDISAIYGVIANS